MICMIKFFVDKRNADCKKESIAINTPSMIYMSIKNPHKFTGAVFLGSGELVIY